MTRWGGETRQNQLYKPFLRGALITVLTIGASLGALNLVVMGGLADLGAVWPPLIQAHGYAQIFGWVGLFIMGVAYHTLIRYRLRPLRQPWLVRPAFGLVAASLVLRFVSQPFATQGWAAAGLVLSALLGLIGISLFVWAMYDTLRYGADRTAPAVYAWYLGAGFLWLWLAAFATVGIALGMVAQRLDTIPAAWDAPYLRAALSGAVVTIILGYSLRTLPALLRLVPAPPRPFYLLLAVYTGSLVLQLPADGNLTGAATWLGGLGALAELGALVAFVWRLNLYRSGPGSPGQGSRSERNPWAARFVQVAYGWLLVAAALNAGYALARLAGQPVPHAFVASYQHALTVGFISCMIVGMSMKLVPGFIGLTNRHPRLAALVFGLLLTGATLRVLTESLAYLYGDPFYKLMAVSGVLEVTALVCYAVPLWHALNQPSYGQAA